MARKRSGRSSKAAQSAPKGAPGATINRINEYRDTLEPGGVDDHLFKRDQILFDSNHESDDEDINKDVGEEVFSHVGPSRGRAQREIEVEDEGDEDPSDDEPVVTPKNARAKIKLKLIRGRFAKTSLDEDEIDGQYGSEDEEDEAWGRQYYSRPSNRREREGDEYDEQREEDRELEEKEVRRLQRRAREAMGGAEDWGLEETDLADSTKADTVEEPPYDHTMAPATSDSAALLRYMETYEPVKLALARDWPLVVHKLEKTARGIKDMEQADGGNLHKGLGWLHYQTLLTYATTLAFYIYLCSLPVQSRPELSTHPILERLWQLKHGVSSLEDLDFAAGSVSEGAEPTNEEDKEDEMAIKAAKQELLLRLLEEEGVENPALNSDENGEIETDFWDEGLEDDELEELLEDANSSQEANERLGKYLRARKQAAQPPAKKGKKSKKPRETEESKGSASGDGSKQIKRARAAKIKVDDPALVFNPLQEPVFVSSINKVKSGAGAIVSTHDDDALGDPTFLDEADATDKEQRKRSLQFHTAKIASTSARRAAARAQRLGGDEDVPYRNRQAARDAALRKAGPAAVSEDLLAIDEVEAKQNETKKKRKESNAEDRTSDDEDNEGYYDLVKRRRTEAKEAKEIGRQNFMAAKFAKFEDDSHADGPRALTRAIEKNRGLTPRRSKSGRNPRVKKRQAYEKAKKKVASQRAVFKGGQASLGGGYQGERTGISTVAKSRKF